MATPRGKKPARKRKLYAWERGIVKSSLPPGDVPKRCGGCGTTHPAKALRHGYCSTCWTPES